MRSDRGRVEVRWRWSTHLEQEERSTTADRYAQLTFLATFCSVFLLTSHLTGFVIGFSPLLRNRP